MNKLIIMKMKSILISLFFTAVAAPLLAQSDTLKTHTPVADRIIYTCPMHPEVISGKPGKCPKCGMELIQKESAASQPKMSMMMCPMHGMVGMDHEHDGEKKDHKKMMKGMGIVMGAMMVVMIILIANH
jgi:hypothetical protein